MQRALTFALGCATLQGALVAVAGHELYPWWWWVATAPTFLVTLALASRRGWRGRMSAGWRVALVLVCAAAAASTSFATAHAVGVTTAFLSITVMVVAVIGLLEQPRCGLALGGLLIGVYVASLAATRPESPGEVLSIFAVTSTVLPAAMLGGRLARRIAAEEETAVARLSRAVLEDRAATASRADRREAERELHDTVLSTLTALGRGSLTSSDSVRRTCAADARFIRRLLERDSEDELGAPDVMDRLDAVTTAMTNAGFPSRLTASSTTRSVELPAAVVVAVAGATREALNNARKHSGATHAEVVVNHDDRLTVTICDSGGGANGLATWVAGPGLGVRRSIIERMDDVGGRATVAATPGGRTEVILCWPRGSGPDA